MASPFRQWRFGKVQQLDAEREQLAQKIQLLKVAWWELMFELRTCCACTCKDYVCIHSQPKWPCHFGSSLILNWETREKVLCYHFVTSYAMASSSYVADTAVSGQQGGVLPPDVPQELAGSIDSFQHVEAVMKEDDVSTVGMDSQDWELVTEMVAETENAATDFMQGKHVSLEAPKQDLQSSLKAMEETMANLKLGTAARGVDVPSASEGAASATAAIGAEAPSRPEGVAPVLAAETEDVQMDVDKEVDPHEWVAHVRPFWESPDLHSEGCPFQDGAHFEGDQAIGGEVGQGGGHWPLFEVLRSTNHSSSGLCSGGQGLHCHQGTKAAWWGHATATCPRTFSRWNWKWEPSGQAYGHTKGHTPVPWVLHWLASWLGSGCGEDVHLQQEGDSHQEDSSFDNHGVEATQVAPFCHWQWHHLGAGRFPGTWSCACRWRWQADGTGGSGPGVQKGACGGHRWPCGGSSLPSRSLWDITLGLYHEHWPPAT